jgi:hypothetical protein
MNAQHPPDDSTSGPPEDDSLIREVFAALETGTGADSRGPQPTSQLDAREEAGLDDSFRAEADSPLSVDDPAEPDDESLDLDESVVLPPLSLQVARGVRGLFSLVGGAALATAAALLFLLWGLGRDPFGVSTRLPTRLVFLLPPEFRDAAQQQPAIANDTPPVGEGSFGIGN